jgi:flagellar M-ring protein FliF
MNDATLPVPVSASSSPSGAMLERVKGFAGQPAVQKSMPLLGIAAAVLIAFLAWTSFAKGPQRDLFSGLNDSDKAAVADTLKTAGVNYTLDRSTGALTVSDGDYYRAKKLLAQAGLPSVCAMPAKPISPARSRRSTPSRPRRSISPPKSRASSSAIRPRPPRRSC